MGMLLSATIMANGCAFDHAVAMVRNKDNLDVGVDLVLTALPPVSSPSTSCGLTDERGRLPGSPRELTVSLPKGRISKESIRQELTSQIGKVLVHGLHPSHLDSHKHIHVFPQVLDAVIELAHRSSISWIRAPFDGAAYFRIGRLIHRESKTSLCIQHMKAKSIGFFRASFYRRIKDSGLRILDHFLGISFTGIWNEALIIHL
jgi:chitin disaccharide deacetylase